MQYISRGHSEVKSYNPMGLQYSSLRELQG